MNYDAMIFDIDGTIWNASPASARGWNLGLAKLGIDAKVSAEQIETVAGKAYEECIDTLLPGLRVKHPALLDTLNDCEKRVMQSDGGTFYEGALECIAALSRRCGIFLASNCQSWYLDIFIAFSGLGPILSGYDCHGKSGLPKKAMLVKIIDAYSLKNPVYIGDTAGDRDAARSAGIAFIHAAWGFGKPDGEMRSADSFGNLLKYMQNTGNDMSKAPLR